MQASSSAEEEQIAVSGNKNFPGEMSGRITVSRMGKPLAENPVTQQRFNLIKTFTYHTVFIFDGLDHQAVFVVSQVHPVAGEGRYNRYATMRHGFLNEHRKTFIT